MIQVTNNVKDFLEKEKGEIFIYGAGNAGYWVGYYMNRCGYEFSGYLDKTIDHEGALYNGKPIYLNRKLLDAEYRDRSLRIIVASQYYDQIISELLWMDKFHKLNALCLIPRYVDLTSKEDGYQINHFLAYFRRKLFKGETPTIISNTCMAGLIYDMFDMVMLSPTINTAIEDAEKFIKLCKNLRQYMEIDMGDLVWTRPFGNPAVAKDYPCGRIGDIEIIFVHVDSANGLKERWNYMRKRINWGRIIYVMSERKSHRNVSFRAVKEFMRLDGEKFFINSRNAYPIGNGVECVYCSHRPFANKTTAIENYFDILGWMNREYMDDTGCDKKMEDD